MHVPAGGSGKDMDAKQWTRFSPPRPFSGEELQASLKDWPPLLNVHEAARLLRISRSTLYHQVSRGMYRDAVKRGTPLVFFRDRLVRNYFRP